jgi:L-alanine-DL-glutamate epimerase-like enolase superfamily enzyme
MKLSIFNDRWEMKAPFVTSKESITHIETITACVSDGRPCGRAEALGVDYLGESATSIREQLESVRSQVESGIDVDAAQELLPPGGARNALDCALWDLKAKETGRRVWDFFGAPAEPVQTVYTLSLDTPDQMAKEAQKYAGFPVLKLKLNKNCVVESLRAIRAARPDAELVIDANCDWSVQILDEVADELCANRIAMVEQPLPVGQDSGLEGFDYPITLCADESCQSYSDLEHCADRYNMVNIKLDKCGGLTEAMKMVQWCRENNIELMVGNMLGSSLAMAPGFIVAQHCKFVDLDGPLWQKTDRSTPLQFENSVISAPESKLWG